MYAEANQIANWSAAIVPLATVAVRSLVPDNRFHHVVF
jgi:hypothetical protein